MQSSVHRGSDDLRPWLLFLVRVRKRLVNLVTWGAREWDWGPQGVLVSPGRWPTLVTAKMSLLSTFFFLTLLLTTPPYSPGHKHHTWGFSEPPFKRPARLFSPVQEDIFLFWAPTDRRSPSWGFQVLREEIAVGTSGGWGSHKDTNKENCKKGLKILYRCREPLYNLGVEERGVSCCVSTYGILCPCQTQGSPGLVPGPAREERSPAAGDALAASITGGQPPWTLHSSPFFNLPGLGLLLLLLKLLGRLRL